MLIDVEFIPIPTREQVVECIGVSEEEANLILVDLQETRSRVIHLGPGFYIGSFSLENDIPDETRLPEKDPYFLSWGTGRRYLNSYGVCDSPEQVAKRYKRVFDDPDRFYVVLFTEIRRENEPERDGWRWHKWGPYIGRKRPKCEYLYDEPNIDRVYVYQIVELKRPQK